MVRLVYRVFGICGEMVYDNESYVFGLAGVRTEVYFREVSTVSACRLQTICQQSVHYFHGYVSADVHGAKFVCSDEKSKSEKGKSADVPEFLTTSVEYFPQNA
ncbi:MAG: hypothetical protein LUC24_02915 [Bacteroidales bacterium]|nr:hypothetical protein [Bacteroidales bacterium]